MVLLLFAWASGDSQEERFCAARAAYVRLHPKRRRPGEDASGFRHALKDFRRVATRDEKTDACHLAFVHVADPPRVGVRAADDARQHAPRF
jgi:hypothetical protein